MNDGMDNQAMFWKLPTINAFHSIVPGSVMEFYESVGVPRSVGSRPEASHYALRSLLSTRWLFDYDNSDNMQYAKSEDKYFEYAGSTKMPGWTYADKQNGFFIYENQYYIPMGFTYDAYFTRRIRRALPVSAGAGAAQGHRAGGGKRRRPSSGSCLPVRAECFLFPECVFQRLSCPPGNGRRLLYPG